MEATQRTAKSRQRVMREMREQEGFDVTCVIGHVSLNGDGPHTPHEAAFLLIAGHDAPGTYSFPMSNGGMCHVAVDYDDELHGKGESDA